MTALASPGTAAGPRAAPDRPRRTRVRPPRWRRLITPVGLVVVWEAASRAGVLPEEKLSPPSEVLRTAWRLTQDGTLATHLVESLTRAGAGLAIGGALALILGSVAEPQQAGD